MPRPTFYVQHFIACLNAPWEGLPGPSTPRTLETVCHRYGVPPDSEPPLVFEEFWMYARLFRTNQAEGEREFSIRVVWLDAPNGLQHVARRDVGRVRFNNAHPTVDMAWVLRPLKLPGYGRYEFRLRCGARSARRDVQQVVAREYVQIEHQP